MKLYIFPISHFCEKARWAMDFMGFDYEVVNLAPGLHIPQIRRMAPKTTVPVLKDGPVVVQGSGEIIDYLEKKAPKRSLMPKDEAARAQVMAWEEMLDEEMGKPLRAYFYSYLLSKPSLCLKLWAGHTIFPKRMMLRLLFPVLAKKVGRLYRCKPELEALHRQAMEATLDKLDEAWSKSPFLVGDQFTRADLTAASLMAPLVAPAEHPFQLKMDEFMRTVQDRYRKRPSFQRVEQLYAQYRKG